MLTTVAGGLIVLLTLAAAGLILGYFARTGAPPVPATSEEVANVVALLEQANLSANATIFELGAGWGTIVLALARAFPGANIVGIEASPIPWAVSALRTRSLPNVEIRFGNFHKADLSGAEAVTCYLMIKPMISLATLLDRWLTPGTPVVTLAFWFRDRHPVSTKSSRSGRGDAALYRWPGQ